MSSLVKVNRVFPLVYPEIFPAASAEGLPATQAASTVGAASPDAADAAAAIHAKRLKSLYQRTLRNQGHSETLTYSGRLSA